jgi:dTDP-4-dehydrorhamnose reductase
LTAPLHPKPPPCSLCADLPERLLVTGAAGLLGRVLVRDAGAGWDVVATVHRSPVEGAASSVAADLRDLDLVRRLIDDVRPAVVINTAALARPDACESDPQLAELLNAAMPQALAERCAAVGARLVHISTDAVYGAATPPFREDARPQPGNVYARTKLAGEEAVLAAAPSSLVVRTNFFGWSESGTRSLAEFFLTELRAGHDVPGFTDVDFTPLYARDLARLLFRAARTDVHGVRNLGGAQRLSKYEFGRAVATAFGLDPAKVQPVSLASAGLAARRSAHLAMDSSRVAAELGLALPTVSDGLERMRADEPAFSRVS